MGDVVMTPEFRVGWQSLFKATKAKDADADAKEKFSVKMLFQKGADLKELKRIAGQALVEKFGADQGKWPKNLRSPFRGQGDVRDDKGVVRDGHTEGATFVNATSVQPIDVVGPDAKRTTDERTVYSGCYGKALVAAYYYDVKGNRGVAFGLRGFQKTKDGEPLSGSRVDVEKAFQPVEGADPFGGGAPAEDDPFK